MKTKTHSGLNKRVIVKKSGTLNAAKSCNRHLLSNKSKKQKAKAKGGVAVDSTRRRSVKKLLVI